LKGDPIVYPSEYHDYILCYESNYCDGKHKSNIEIKTQLTKFIDKKYIYLHLLLETGYLKMYGENIAMEIIYQLVWKQKW